jgi:hypothetical protein
MYTPEGNIQKTEGATMKTNFYFIGWKDQGNPNKITRKEAMELFGAERFKEVMTDAKETYSEDPGISIEYMVANGRINIEFN